MRRVILFALCALAHGAAVARDYTVEDLLGLESYGEVAIAPPEKLVLVERRRPYGQAVDFGYGAQFNTRMLSRILATRTDRTGPLEPLFEQAPDAGYWMAGTSPSKRRLAVYRLQRRTLSLGVVDLRTRRVKWFAPSPDTPTTSPNPVWLNDDDLAFISMPERRLPGGLLSGSAYLEDLNGLYRVQSSGGASGTVVSTIGGPEPDATRRRLVRVSCTDDRVTTLSEGDIVDFSVSPGSSMAAVLLAGRPVLPGRASISVSFDARRHHIAMVDLANGKSRDVPGDAMRGFMSWSADGRLLALMRDDVPDWSGGYYAVVDRGGAVERLGGSLVHADVMEEGGGRIVHAGWAGRSPVGLMTESSGRKGWMRLSVSEASPIAIGPTARPVGTTTRSLWMLEGERLVEIGEMGLRILASDVARGRTNLLEPFNEGFRVDMNPVGTGALVVKAKSGLGVVPSTPSGGLGERIALPPGTTPLAAASDVAVGWSSDGRNQDRLYLVRPGRPPLLIDRLNKALVDVVLPRAVRLTSKDGNGATLYHWLVLPTRTNGKVPMIVVPYPGFTFGSERPGQLSISRRDLSANALLLASAGYAVLLPSMPTSPGGANPSRLVLPQVDVAVDAAIAEGHVDGSRLGVLGHSFGGYAALTLATGSDRYGAVVSSNGPSDLAMMHGSISGPDKIRLEHGIPFSSSAGWVEAGQGGMRVSPSQDPAAYVSASPVMRMDAVHRPLMLIGGDLDPVDMGHAERAFMEAARSGADATLVRFWGEGHGVSSPGNVHQYWDLVIGFFDRTLGARPARSHD